MKHFISFFMFMALSLTGFGQDLEFTQFYANPLYLNPAFAGSHGCPRINMNYRDQWPSLSGSYVSYAAAYDQYISGISGGIGVLLVNDVQAKTINTTSGSLIYSYHTPLNRKWTLLFGAKTTWVQKTLDWSKLTFGDMIDPRKGFVYTSGDKPTNGNEVGFFDVSSGFVVYSKDFNIGVAANHLTQPNESMIGNEEDPLPMRFTGHASANIPLNKSKYTSSTTLMPSLIYTYQNGFSQLNIGAYVKYSNMTFGAWYRSLDAFILTIGVNTGTFRVGYSYDVTASRLNNGVSGGSHEVSLGLNLNCKPKAKKFRTISCPSF